MTNAPHEHELHAYLDGELDESGRERVEAWLAARPDEARRLGAYRRQKGLVRAALAQAADDGEPEATTRLARRLADRLGQRRWPSVAQMAAGFALFALGAMSHVMIDLYQEWRLPRVVEAATRAHQVFSEDPVRPVELPAFRRAEMVAWFGQHLGTEVTIPDLRMVGLRFVGGRLLAGEVGPMAQLLYEDRTRSRLSIYLSAGEAGGGHEVEVVRIADYAAGYWKDGELTYTIVGEMASENLLEIAAELNGVPAQSLF